MAFVLQFVMWCVTLADFAYTDFFYPWDKSHLIMVYDPFNVFLDSTYYYFVKDFCVYNHYNICL